MAITSFLVLIVAGTLSPPRQRARRRPGRAARLVAGLARSAVARHRLGRTGLGAVPRRCGAGPAPAQPGSRPAAERRAGRRDRRRRRRARAGPRVAGAQRAVRGRGAAGLPAGRAGRGDGRHLDRLAPPQPALPSPRAVADPLPVPGRAVPRRRRGLGGRRRRRHRAAGGGDHPPRRGLARRAAGRGPHPARPTRARRRGRRADAGGDAAPRSACCSRARHPTGRSRSRCTAATPGTASCCPRCGSWPGTATPTARPGCRESSSWSTRAS